MALHHWNLSSTILTLQWHQAQKAKASPHSKITNSDSMNTRHQMLLLICIWLMLLHGSMSCSLHVYIPILAAPQAFISNPCIVKTSELPSSVKYHYNHNSTVLPSISSNIFPKQNFVYTSCFPHVCHTPSPPHPSQLNYPNNARWQTQTTKFPIPYFPFLSPPDVQIFSSANILKHSSSSPWKRFHICIWKKDEDPSPNDNTSQYISIIFNPLCVQTFHIFSIH